METRLTKRRVVLVLIAFLAVALCALALMFFARDRGRGVGNRPLRPAFAEARAVEGEAGTAQTEAPAAGDSAVADWPQFRGPMGNGISSDTTVPLEWSDTKNMRWQSTLPGPGASSPIISGGNVFVTCYSGYGVDREKPGQVKDLKRHLLCVKFDTGEVVWSRAVDAVLPEDDFSGMGMTEHGYASNTPVTDGERVYVFFGKTGVLAFDFQGNELWRADVGHESSNRRWGSSASLVLYRDTVIVNASEESQSIRALDKRTGKERWKAEGTALELTYATPVIVGLNDGRKELVLGVPNEVWGLNPDSGRLLWYAKTGLGGNVGPSPVSREGVVYVTGGYPKQSTVAVRAGGQGEVTGSQILWSVKDGSYIPSPVVSEGYLYWMDDKGFANCIEAATGKTVYRERLPHPSGGESRKAHYASVVLIGERLYALGRSGATFVLPAKPTFEVLACNTIANDGSDFNASPAVSKGKILLRSNRMLYCIGGE